VVRLIKKEDRAQYFLQGSFTSGIPSDEDKFTGKEWHGFLKLPEVGIHP
jgi:hypothetical protein